MQVVFFGNYCSRRRIDKMVKWGEMDNERKGKVIINKRIDEETKRLVIGRGCGLPSNV